MSLFSFKLKFKTSQCALFKNKIVKRKEKKITRKLEQYVRFNTERNKSFYCTKNIYLNMHNMCKDNWL